MIRSIDKWLPGYLASALLRPRSAARGRHLILCVADHFEPFRGGVDRTVALAQVNRWADEYPRLFSRFRDADGCPPRHTFFCPADEYDAKATERLLPLVHGGYGEIEVHLHHRHDTPEGLRDKLVRFRDVLHAEHGCLGTDGNGAPRYGFIHGNWALCNSRPDGDWCGVNDELAILSETGCYADFTFPSAPSPTQPRMVNAIYLARDTGRPRAADGGDRVRAWRGRRGAGDGMRDAGYGRGEGVSLTEAQRTQRDTGCGIRRTAGDCRGYKEGGERGATVAPAVSAGSGEGRGVMIIQGPLALDWRRRKWGIFPRLENGELSGVNPPSAQRLSLWLRQSISVVGQPDWVFVKVHTHGCVEANAAAILGAPMIAFHDELVRLCEDGGWIPHYVTAREMCNMVLAAEGGCDGNPGLYRDFVVGKPAAARK